MAAKIYPISSGLVLRQLNAFIFILITTYNFINGCKEFESGRFVCQNDNLMWMPRDIPASAKYIDVSKNNITRIWATNLVDLPLLEYLIASQNHLIDIEDGSFLHQSKLKDLNLKENYFKVITRAALMGLENLQTLNIEDNRNVKLDIGTLQVLTSLEKFIGSGNIFMAFYNFSDVVNLRELILDRCDIIELSTENFKGLNSLTFLTLKHNFLRRVPSNILQEMPNLEELSIESNLIEILLPSDFSGNEQLRSIRLNHNRITRVSSKTFQGLRHLTLLDLYENDIYLIDENAFGTVDSTYILRVSLQGNELFCDCHMRWLTKWAQKEHHILEGAVCTSPFHVIGNNITDIKLQDLQCPPSIDPEMPRELLTGQGQAITLHCPIKADPVLVIWWISPIDPRHRMYVGDIWAGHTVLPDGSLHIRSPNTSFCGDYICLVSNDVGYMDAMVSVAFTTHSIWYVSLILFGIICVIITLIFFVWKTFVCAKTGFSPGYRTI